MCDDSFVSPCGSVVVPHSNVKLLSSPSASLPSISSLPMRICAFNAVASHSGKFYDNACSYSMVTTLDSLDNVKLLMSPFYIGGIGGSSLYATHVGMLKGFPANLAKAYWGPRFDVDLISLGYIQRCGGYYVGYGGFLTVYNSDGSVVDKTALLPNNLSPMTFYAISSREESVTTAAKAFTGRRYTAEEIDHMNVAEQLHLFFDHPSDSTLIDGIDHGHVPTFITSAAVRNNRLLRGPCPHCLAGKLTNDSMPPSTTEPESVVGHSISSDVHQLPFPTPNGYTHKSNMVDHKTGHFGLAITRTKKESDMVDGFKKYIANNYNAHGHKVINLLTDAEGIYTAVRPHMGAIGVNMGMTPPHQHAQRVERYTRTADERKRSTLSALPFVLPSKYEIYADLKVAKSMNDLPNTLTSPTTPTISVEGKRPTYHRDLPFLKFGAVCMVQQYPDKIHSQAKLLNTSVGSVPKAELGVCMGTDPSHRGSYLFVVANGQVVPRRVIREVNVHPWDWKRKFSPTAELIVPKIPRFNQNVQLSTNLDYVDPTPSVADNSFQSTAADALAPIVFDTFSDQIFEFSPAIEPPSAETVAGSIPVELPVSSSLPLLPALNIRLPPVAVVPPPPQMLLVPTADVVVPPAVVASSAAVSSNPPSASLELSSSVSPVHVVPPISSAAPVLRRSERLRTPAVPGAHRSYVGQAAVHPSDHLQWTPVVGNKKGNARILRQHVTFNVSEPHSQHSSLLVHAPLSPDLSMLDAITYLASATSSASSLSAFSAMDILQPQPSTKCVETSLKRSLQPGFAAAQDVVHEAVCKHLDMLTQDLSAISLIADSQIEPGCVRVYAHLLVKVKADERCTARLAAGGNRQPLSSHGETYAPTASETSSNTLLAAYQALGKQHQLPVHINVFDLSNAFQNTPLDKVNYPSQIIMLMPPDLPGRYASYSGQWVEVHKAINGLRQANELFDKEVRLQMSLAGFEATCDPCVYHKQDPLDCRRKCTINMHVDDGLSMDTSDQFYQDAVTQLTKRWGQLKFQNGESIVYNGKNITTLPNGAIALSMQSYISRAAKELGVAHLPPIAAPSGFDLFHPPVNKTPVCNKVFAKFAGCLTHVTTKGRFDVRKESQHLSKQLKSPTEDDMRKMIQVWQYLNCTASLGPVYDTDEGATLVLHTDAAFAVHDNGASHTGSYLSLGRHNAPIWVMSKPQEDIALSPQASEYYGLSDPCQALLWHRQLLTDMGFPQGRTVVWEDNIPVINLAYSPQITRKARYMFVRHHFVRSLVQNKIIQICHVETAEQAADLLTHSLKPAQFKRHRYRLFNLCSRPTA